MTADPGTGPAQPATGSDDPRTGGERVVLTGPVIDEPPLRARLGETLAAAGAHGRQGLELIAGAIRGVAAVLRLSAVAGLAGALIVTLIWDPAFDMRWWTALILFGILALPALEVLAHRAVLLRLWGDAARLEARARTVTSSLAGGADDFAERMAALRKGSPDGGAGRGRTGMGAARSAMGLRDVAGAVPGLTGLLLFPLRRGLLALTAACTGLCWVVLVLGVPVAVLVGIGAALAG